MSGVLPREARVLLFRHRRVLRAVAITIAVVVAISVLRPSSRRGVQVIVAAHDLAAGVALKDSDLQSKTIPRDLLPDGVITPGAPILGHTLTGAARRGEVLTDRRIFDGGYISKVHPGMVAKGVLVDPTQISLLHPGVRVDLSRPAEDEATGEKIAHGALVLAVPKAEDGSSDQTRPVIVLELSDEDADAVTAAEKPDTPFKVTVVG